MQLKKLLQGSIFAVMAAACAIAVPTVAKAADPTGTFTDAGITSVSVDGTKGQMEIQSSAKEVLVGIGKANTKKGTITVASWSTYEPASNKVTVDLSKLKNVADNYMVVTTPGKDVSIVKIPAVAKATKAKYDAANGEVAIASGDKVGNGDMKAFTTKDTGSGASAVKATMNQYEFRTDYSGWQDVSTLKTGTGDAEKIDFSLYQEEGAKLVFRLKGEADGTTALTQLEEAYTWAETGTKAKVYEAASLPGKEAKVTIAAKAKGPKATADYVKGTVKFPKKSEYRIATTDKLQAAKDGAYVDAPTDAAAVADIFTAAGKVDTALGTTVPSDFNIEVRTKASDKKGASKWSVLAVKTPADLEDSSKKLLDNTNSKTQKDKASGWDTQTTAEKEAGDGGIKLATMKEATDGTSVLAINYVTKGKLDATKYFTANAVEIKNSGTKTYEIVTGAKDADEAAKVTKATKVAPNKTVVLSKLDDGTSVWIRVAGDKKTMTWVSKYGQLGVVDYPATVPAQAAASN